MQPKDFDGLAQHLEELQSNLFLSTADLTPADYLDNNNEIQMRAALAHLEMTAERVVRSARMLLGKPDDIAHRSSDLTAAKVIERLEEDKAVDLFRTADVTSALVIERLRPFMKYVASTPGPNYYGKMTKEERKAFESLIEAGG